MQLPKKKSNDNKNNKKANETSKILDKNNNKENKNIKNKDKNNEMINKNNTINSNYSDNANSYKPNIKNKSKNNNNPPPNFYINKIQNNISNIIDFIQDQNDYYSPSNFNKIDSTFVKPDNLKKSKSKKSSPSSQNKLKFSSINNNNNNRNNSQVMINVNTNIINSNGSIEKFKLYKKIKDYHRIFERKINEITRNIIPKSIKRTLSAFQNRRHSSPNFYDNHRQEQYYNINKN